MAFSKLLLCFVLIGMAQAFLAPMNSVKSSSKVIMSAEFGRRDFFKAALGSAALVGASLPAFADGAVSTATVERARGVYGDRILSLQGAVSSGNFGAVASDLNAFKLFSSGAYAKKSIKDKAAKKVVDAAISDLTAAIDTKNVALLKSSYDTIVKTGKLGTSPFSGSVNEGQGFSADYDWKVRTKRGTVYQR